MAGEYLNPRYLKRKRDAEINRLITLGLAMFGILVMAIAALYVSENQFKTADRSNQEQLIWSCTGSDVSSCNILR